jgi:hypothetical protein
VFGVGVGVVGVEFEDPPPQPANVRTMKALLYTASLRMNAPVVLV